MHRSVWKTATTLYGLALLVGVLAGGCAILFEYLSQFVAHTVLGGMVGYAPDGPRGEPALFDNNAGKPLLLAGLLIAPFVGGVVSGLICRIFAPEASGHGTDAVIDAYHNHGGNIRARVPLVKALTTAISLGSGGSGGKEGPIAQIGAGIGSLVGRLLHLSSRQRRILLAAGMGAGVGAIFRAPLAGALFAAEILYRDAEFESDVLLPSILSSAAAYCVYCGWFQDFSHLFDVSTGSFAFENLRELLPYTVLALVIVPAVFVYTKIFYGTDHLFRRMPGPHALKVGLGALGCGCVAVGFYSWSGDPHALAVLSYGYGILQSSLDQEIGGWAGVQLLAMVAVLKILTTSLTISSGGSGGVFGPSMVIGGCLGGSVGIACQELGMPDLNTGCFVIVGMCGFFAGAARTPISTIIMVSEMTGSYELLLPSMWVCGLTFLLGHRWTIYEKQVPNRAFSKAHRGEFLVPLLQSLRVSDVVEKERKLTSVQQDTPLADVIKIVHQTHDDYFPVLDSEQRFVGIFSAHDVREFTFDDTLHHLAIAADLMTVKPITLTTDMDLHTALSKFSIKNLDELPVVAQDDDTRLLGMLRRRAITRAYNVKLAELKELQNQDQ